MALYTDPEIVTLEDLTQFESALVQVSVAHGIDVQTKIEISIASVGDKLTLWLLRAGAADPWLPASPLLSLSNLTLTTAISRWLCFDALARVFAEAYNIQLNTRFQGKLTEYQAEAKEASALVYASGAGIVRAPLPKPTQPTVTIGTGALSAPALFVQTTWIDRKGQESAPSPISASVLNGFASVSVMQSCQPETATGFNIYAGTSGSSLTRQTDTPLTIGSSWSLSTNNLDTSGDRPSQGQGADFIFPFTGRLQRG